MDGAGLDGRQPSNMLHERSPGVLNPIPHLQFPTPDAFQGCRLTVGFMACQQ
jgi:hypothetical protein